MEPVSAIVARNVAELRDLRHLSHRGLAAELTEIGYKTTHSAVSKVENGQRRVHVDALCALAVALGCSPNRLLLPGRPDGPVALTPNVEVDWGTAWRWASGETPLGLGEKALVTDPRMREFIELSRPFEQQPTSRELARWLLARVPYPFTACAEADNAGRPKARITQSSGGEDGNGGNGAAT
jgi:transcriptional regulator with XRE-family HTH domain